MKVIKVKFQWLVINGNIYKYFNTELEARAYVACGGLYE